MRPHSSSRGANVWLRPHPQGISPAVSARIFRQPVMPWSVAAPFRQEKRRRAGKARLSRGQGHRFA